MTGFSIRV